MTDPIKEQAEKEAERLWRVSCPEYLSWPLIDHEDKGKWVKCDWKMLKEIFYELIEKHIREKASLESQLAEAKAELSRLRNYCTLTYGFSHPEIKKCSHEMELEEERQLADELAEALDQHDALMSESFAVEGLHLNGDVAEWEWLKQHWLDKHDETLSKHKKKRGEG